MIVINLTLENAGLTIVYNRIAAGENMTMQSHFTVPRAHRLYMMSWNAGSVGNKPMRILLRATCDYHNRELNPGVYHFQDIIMSSNQDQVHDLKAMMFPAECDIKISGAMLGGVTGEGGGGFAYWMEPINGN